MFLLTSSITIGDYENVKVHEAVIRTAVRNFINEASLKIPIRAKVITPDDLTAKVLKTSTIFKEGMKVKIDLGYNSQNVNEFTGFIARVNFKSPIELVCEGYSYQLRKMTYPAITFTNSTVKEILQFLIKGTDIVLADVIEHIPIPKLPISGQSGVEVLRKMSDLLNNTVLFRFKNNVLSVDFFPLKEESGLVNYYVGWNVIRSDDLKKREAQNQDVEVNYISEQKDGSKLLATKGKLKNSTLPVIGTAGKKGEVKKFVTHSINDQPTLDKMANAKHFSLSFDGYEGKITTFLQPYCEPGYKAILEDEMYPERNGNYLVSSVETRYNMSGARRTVEIGHQL